MLEHAVASSLTVEQASAADIPLIMSIERSPGYPTLVGSYGADEHRRRMEAPICNYLLCRSAGELVGFAVIRRDDDGMGTAQCTGSRYRHRERDMARRSCRKSANGFSPRMIFIVCGSTCFLQTSVLLASTEAWVLSGRV